VGTKGQEGDSEDCEVVQKNDMQMETKFLRLRTEVELSSLFDDWQVCWLGGWSKTVLLGNADEDCAVKGSRERNAAEPGDSVASGCVAVTWGAGGTSDLPRCF